MIDTCTLAESGEHFALVQMPSDEPDYAPYTPCDPNPPTYSSAFVPTKVHVVEALSDGAFEDGDDVQVLFLWRQFSWLDWEQGDYLLLSLREDGGEWFATSAFHATPSTDNVAGDANANRGAGSGEVQFDLPTKTSELRSELRAVDADYKGRCGRSQMSDSDFEYGMRHDPSCDFDPADPSIEEDGDPSEGSNNDTNGGE